MPLFSLDILSSRRDLSKAITLIESEKQKDLRRQQNLIAKLAEFTGTSIRIGITGTPGVGKSTLIEALGLKLIQKGMHVAVLAIDPSSPKTKGSILGDKTRMQQLSVHPNAYVRPSPTGGHLGGIAPATRDAMLLCEAAGFDVTIIETVGVGQSEAEVAQLVDVLVLLLQPGAGDELQSIKRGLLELPDIICVNKCDGELEGASKKTLRVIKSAIALGGKKNQCRCISAISSSGITQLATDILDIHAAKSSTEKLDDTRAAQAKYWEKRAKMMAFERGLG